MVGSFLLENSQDQLHVGLVNQLCLVHRYTRLSSPQQDKHLVSSLVKHQNTIE